LKLEYFVFNEKYKMSQTTMWGKSNKIVQSYFYVGISSIQKSVTSFYGKFINIIKNLFDVESMNSISETLIIPKVIVIGAESSGKSSLLENICKCPIFPRNSNICTKQPIRLILKTALKQEEINYSVTYKKENTNFQDKSMIFDKIQSIMSRLGNDEISEDEIIITIKDIDVPNFELYDLPGIRAYPTEMAEKTLKLATKYLSEPNNIVLCVIPSTTPRVTSYPPIGLIKQFKKENNTILALTMADRIQSENIYELLIKRITNQTDEFNHNEFAGCVAVINRSHKDNISLQENDNFEDRWFIENVIEHMPEDFPREQAELIYKNIKIENLVNNLDKLYNRFIEQYWIPQTIDSLETKYKNIKEEIDNLGIPIENINIDELRNYYTKFIKWDDKIVEDGCENEEDEEDEDEDWGKQIFKEMNESQDNTKELFGIFYNISERKYEYCKYNKSIHKVFKVENKEESKKNNKIKVKNEEEKNNDEIREMWGKQILKEVNKKSTPEYYALKEVNEKYTPEYYARIFFPPKTETETMTEFLERVKNILLNMSYGDSITDNLVELIPHPYNIVRFQNINHKLDKCHNELYLNKINTYWSKIELIIFSQYLEKTYEAIKIRNFNRFCSCETDMEVITRHLHSIVSEENLIESDDYISIRKRLNENLNATREAIINLNTIKQQINTK